MSQMTISTQMTKRKGVFARAWQAVTSKTAKALYNRVAMPLLLWMAAQGYAQAEDLAKSGVTDASDTFGEGSSVMYYVMLAEFVMVVIGFIKTQNPAVLLLIPVFIVATKVIWRMATAPTP